jgi:hypothetical protein
MNKLETFTKNPFETIITTKNSIQKFGHDHIQRAIAANNPNFATMILDSKTAWQKVFGNLQTYDADKNLQQSFTVQLNAKMQEFIDKALDLESLVAYKLKKDSGPYQEFYPYGRSEYHNAIQENIFDLMKRMIDGAHKYATELGATLEAEFTTLRDDFQIIYDLQKEKKGDVSEAIPDYEIKVKLLFDQLFKNMCLILAEYNSNPQAMLAFFDQTIVNHAHHPGEGETGYILLVPSFSQAVADISFSPDDTLLIRSNSEKELKFYFTPDPAMPPMVVPTILAPNAEIEVKCSDAGAPTNKFLIFINGNDTDGEVEIVLV